MHAAADAGDVATPFQVRGGLAKLALREALLQAPDAADKLPTAALLALQHASSLDWVSGDDFLAVFGELRRAVGEERFRGIWRRSWGGWLQGPLVKGLLEPVLQAFGVGPGAIFRIGAFASEFAARGFGTLRVDVADGEVALRLSGVPAELVEGGTFASMIAGALASALDQAGVAGTVEIEGVDAPRGQLTVRSRYRAPSS